MHTKQLTQWHPNVYASGVKHDIYDQSLHPACHCILFWATTFTFNHFVSTQESIYYYPRAQVMGIHHLVFCISTLYPSKEPTY